MREMRDSGITWLGDVPIYWRVIKLKHLLRNGLQYGANESGVDYDDNLPRYIRITDISSENELKEDGKLSLTEEMARGYILNDGDVLLARSGASVGKSFIYKSRYGRAAFAGYLIRAQLNEKKMIPSFFFYNTLGAHYQTWKDLIFNQATIQNIGADKYSNLELVVPPLQEQIRIVDYLKNKCRKIDAIISKQESIVEKLTDYLLYRITEAVTQGLDSDVEMTESGEDWLGKYPSHWDYRKLKYILHERNEKNIPIQTSERLSLSIDKGVTLYAEKTTNLDRFKDDVSQYKLAHEGDLVLNSMNMIVGAIGVSNYFGCVSPAYYTYYDDEKDHITARYCDYLLRCKTMRRVLFGLGKGIMAIDRGDDKINTCRLKVSRDDFRSLRLPLPPVDEQREIVMYLDRLTEKVNLVTGKRKKLIERYQDLKKSLIYEVVTGKKEVF